MKPNKITGMIKFRNWYLSFCMLFVFLACESSPQNAPKNQQVNYKNTAEIYELLFINEYDDSLLVQQHIQEKDTLYFLQNDTINPKKYLRLSKSVPYRILQRSIQKNVKYQFKKFYIYNYILNKYLSEFYQSKVQQARFFITFHNYDGDSIAFKFNSKVFSKQFIFDTDTITEKITDKTNLSESKIYADEQGFFETQNAKIIHRLDTFFKGKREIPSTYVRALLARKQKTIPPNLFHAFGENIRTEGDYFNYWKVNLDKDKANELVLFFRHAEYHPAWIWILDQSFGKWFRVAEIKLQASFQDAKEPVIRHGIILCHQDFWDSESEGSFWEGYSLFDSGNLKKVIELVDNEQNTGEAMPPLLPRHLSHSLQSDFYVWNANTIQVNYTYEVASILKKKKKIVYRKNNSGVFQAQTPKLNYLFSDWDSMFHTHDFQEYFRNDFLHIKKHGT